MSEITYIAKAGLINREMLNDFYPCLVASAYMNGKALKFLTMVHPILKEIRYEIWLDDAIKLDTPLFDMAMAEFNDLFAHI